MRKNYVMYSKYAKICNLLIIIFVQCPLYRVHSPFCTLYTVLQRGWEVVTLSIFKQYTICAECFTGTDPFCRNYVEMCQDGLDHKGQPEIWTSNRVERFTEIVWMCVRMGLTTKPSQKYGQAIGWVDLQKLFKNVSSG